MKTLTCRQLGGACDAQIAADSWAEMAKLMTQHVTANHPEVAKAMEEIYRTDPERWSKEHKAQWERAPDTASRATA